VRTPPEGWRLRRSEQLRSLEHANLVDLRGHELRGADLRGADLRQADLRGVDLCGADLRHADLSGARTGLGKTAAVLHIGGASLVSAAGGFTSSWLGQFIQDTLQSPDEARQIGGLLLSAEFVICLVAMVWRGTLFTVQHVLLPTGALLLVTCAGMLVLRQTVHGSGLLVASLVVLFAAMFGAVVVARASAAAAHGLGTVAVLVAWFLGALVAKGHFMAMLVAMATAVAGLRAAAGSTTSPRLSRWVRHLAAVGGTSMRAADLRHANFTGARLRSSDLRGAKLDGCELRGARELRFCRLDDDKH
jgi:hypothetical protein